MSEELKSFKQRRLVVSQQNGDRYTLDMGERHVCEHCGSTYYKSKKGNTSGKVETRVREESDAYISDLASNEDSL